MLTKCNLSRQKLNQGSPLCNSFDYHFKIIKPRKDLGGLLDFGSEIIDERINMGFADCIKMSEGRDKMPKISNANISHKYYEIMERVFTSKENVIEFCRKYNKTVKFQAIGGVHFWENIFEVDNYKIQCQTWMTSHIRTLENIKISCITTSILIQFTY